LKEQPSKREKPLLLIIIDSFTFYQIFSLFGPVAIFLKSE